MELEPPWAEFYTGTDVLPLGVTQNMMLLVLGSDRRICEAYLFPCTTSCRLSCGYSESLNLRETSRGQTNTTRSSPSLPAAIHAAESTQIHLHAADPASEATWRGALELRRPMRVAGQDATAGPCISSSCPILPKGGLAHAGLW